MNILYIAPDIPVPHTGDFVGGSTHVIKIAENIAKRKNNKVVIVSRRVSRVQKKYEEIGDNIFTRRVYRGLVFPIQGAISSKGGGEGGGDLYDFIEKVYFFGYRLLLILLVLHLLKKHKIDAVLDRSSSKGIGVFSGFLFQTPTIVELLDPHYSNLSLKLADRSFAYTTRIVNPDLRDKVEIVNAGVDTNIFKPDEEGGMKIRKKYHLEGKKVVAYLGVASVWHGVGDLVGVADKLDEERVRFLLIGKGFEDRLRAETRREGVEDKFVFTGFVRHEEVPKYLSAADIAVAPYNPRGFEKMEKYGFYFSPIKIFEYMSCGKPVVASNLNIIRDVITESRCGLLAVPGDTDDFAVKIKMLLGNRDLIGEMGERGRRAAIERYSWERVAEKIEGAFQDLLRGRKKCQNL